MRKILGSLNSGIAMMMFALVLSGCGGGSNNATAPSTAAPATPGTCPAGQTYTQYGCVAQGSCPVNYAMYNNSCVPATTPPNTNTQGCPTGQVHTQYGCFAQGSCPVNYAWYNNSCVAATPATPGNPYNNPYPQQNNCPAGTQSINVQGVGIQCLGQGSCAPGQVSYNNQCYQVQYTQGGGYQGQGGGYQGQGGGASFSYSYGF